MSRNAQAEAQARLPPGLTARVLEPSPPAVTEPPWFADDPVARGDATGRVVSPVPTGDVLWSEIAAGDAELEAFCRDRWLGPYRRLEPLPPGFKADREHLHHIAERVLKPAREQATGKIGLRYTLGGFGTPFFGEDRQIRVQDGALDGDQVAKPASGRAIGDWFGFAFSVLEELRAAHPDRDPSRVQIWPEHFDAALELGEERAAYGASPGDEHHPEPYLYVAPWTARPEGELWQATGFPGAELSYAELLAAEDQRATALRFYTTRLEAL